MAHSNHGAVATFSGFQRDVTDYDHIRPDHCPAISGKVVAIAPGWRFAPVQRLHHRMLQLRVRKERGGFRWQTLIPVKAWTVRAAHSLIVRCNILCRKGRPLQRQGNIDEQVARGSCGRCGNLRRAGTGAGR
jgi:hypothetical protein